MALSLRIHHLHSLLTAFLFINIFSDQLWVFDKEMARFSSQSYLRVTEKWWLTSFYFLSFFFNQWTLISWSRPLSSVRPSKNWNKRKDMKMTWTKMTKFQFSRRLFSDLKIAPLAAIVCLCLLANMVDYSGGVYSRHREGEETGGGKVCGWVNIADVSRGKTGYSAWQTRSGTTNENSISKSPSIAKPVCRTTKKITADTTR